MLKERPFVMPEVKLPVFPEKDFRITDFGAKPDGVTNNAAAINAAIDECSKSGGGRVIIPAGLWMTGPIFLKSGVNLHACRNALVNFTGDCADYPLYMAHFEGIRRLRATSPITAHNVENIAITGEGVFDGNGQAWRPVKIGKTTKAQWAKLIKTGVVSGSGDNQMWWPDQSAYEGSQSASAGMRRAAGNITDEVIAELSKYSRFYRPVMVSIVSCSSILIEGVTLQNSPSWCLHPLFCEHVTLRNVNIRNPWYAQNGDALDLESCRYAVIENCTFDAGDDGICIKSGRDRAGRESRRPTEYVSVRGCTVFHGHGGFVVGSEMSCGVHHLTVEDCVFIGTDVGLRFKSCVGRGGTVSDIFINNIIMKDIAGEAILLTMEYSDSSGMPEESYPEDDIPTFRDIYISEITSVGSASALKIAGLKRSPIDNIHISDSYLEAEAGVNAYNAGAVVFSNATIVTPGKTNTLSGTFTEKFSF